MIPENSMIMKCSSSSYFFCFLSIFSTFFIFYQFLVTLTSMLVTIIIFGMGCILNRFSFWFYYFYILYEKKMFISGNFLLLFGLNGCRVEFFVSFSLRMVVSYIFSNFLVNFRETLWCHGFFSAFHRSFNKCLLKKVHFEWTF